MMLSHMHVLKLYMSSTIWSTIIPYIVIDYESVPINDAVGYYIRGPWFKSAQCARHSNTGTPVILDIITKSNALHLIRVVEAAYNNYMHNLFFHTKASPSITRPDYLKFSPDYKLSNVPPAYISHSCPIVPLYSTSGEKIPNFYVVSFDISSAALWNARGEPITTQAEDYLNFNPIFTLHETIHNNSPYLKLRVISAQCEILYYRNVSESSS